MKIDNSIAMYDHPGIKVVSFFIGLFGGAQTLLSAPFLQTHWQEFVSLGIACAKAFTLAGFAWAGQTAISWARKNVVRKWRNRNKK